MVKKTIRILVVLLLLFSIFTVPSFGQTIIDKTTSITLAWDHDGLGVDHYEVQFIRDVSLTQYNYGTPNKTIVIARPKSGIYTIMVRAVGLDGQGLPLYSEWCSSLTVCAVNGPWKVRWRPKAPVGPIIIF
jgi:hypothetical protein